MADDDIIELTQIVKPGNAPAQPADTPPLPPDFNPQAPGQPSSTVPDFGADLDALLQSCEPSRGGVSTASSTQQPDFEAQAPSAGQELLTETQAGAGPASGPNSDPVAAPIENQHDTGRVVDPHEELDLPPLSDLDALLEELGVQDNSQATQAQGVSTLADDLDAFSAPAGSSAASHATGSAAAEFTAPADAVPFAPFEVEAENPAAVNAGAGAQLDDLSGAAQSAPQAVDNPAESDGIDLNELDALLDSVLASAPKPAPEQPVTAESRPVAQPEDRPASAGAGSDLESLQAEVLALKTELADLRANIEKYAAAAAAKVIREELSNLANLLE